MLSVLSAADTSIMMSVMIMITITIWHLKNLYDRISGMVHPIDFGSAQLCSHVLHIPCTVLHCAISTPSGSCCVCCDVAEC